MQVNALNKRFPLDRLTPAEYNPRRLSEESRAALQRSIARLGLVKPIIADENGLIIAGHQRSRAAMDVGRKTGPVFVVPAMGGYDEVRFNQLHNGTDIDALAPPCAVDTSRVKWEGPFGMAPAEALAAGEIQQGGVILGETQALLLKFGDWGCAVMDDTGQVISGQFYAMGRSRMGQPFRVSRVKAKDAEFARKAFGMTYGVFSYEHIERNTWNQSWAQLPRSADESDKKSNKSTLYERHVIPDLKPGESVLDFGSGRGGYARHLRAQGFDVVDYEPYRKYKTRLDVRSIRLMGLELARRLRTTGRFDKVVCDSVLNSVDSLEAEAHVVKTLSALCKPGGTIYVSGRRLDRVKAMLSYKTSTKKKHATRRGVEFLDEHGFSGALRNGKWFFQKMHSKEGALELARQHMGEVIDYKHGQSTSWQMEVCNGNIPFEQAIESLRYEMHLPLPDGVSLGNMPERVMDAYATAYSL